MTISDNATSQTSLDATPQWRDRRSNRNRRFPFLVLILSSC